MATYQCKLTIPVDEITPRHRHDQDVFHVDIPFTAVPTDKVGTSGQAEQTRRFTIVLDVLGIMLDSHPWTDYSDVDRNKHLFAFAQERLHRDGLPEERRKVYPLDWDTDKENRFAKGPPYTLANIHPEEPFEISGSGQIGFSQAP